MDKLKRLSYLISLASVLQIFESYFPHPLPGVRFGFANLIVMVSMFEFGLKEGIYIAVMRVILSSFILGTFMSPTFFLSFSGAIISSLFMGIFILMGKKSRFFYLSIIGISVVGSTIHSFTQFLVVYFLFIKSKAIFNLLPLIVLGSFATGIINGIIGRIILEKTFFVFKSFRLNIENFKDYKKEDISTGLLIFIFFITGVFIILSDSFKHYFYIFIFEVFLFFLLKINMKEYITKLKNIFFLLAFSFFIPYVFDKNLSEGIRYFLKLFLFSNLSFVIFSKISFYNLRKFFEKFKFLKKEVFIIGLSISIYPVIFENFSKLLKIYFYNLKDKKFLLKKIGWLISDLYSGKNFKIL